MRAAVRRHSGSFRDPSGQIYESEERVFRAIHAQGASEYEAARPMLESLVAAGRLVAFEEISSARRHPALPNAAYVLEHPRLKPITFPYEWPFLVLKEAALFHLRLHLDLLASGFTLSDATAYNVQFRGTKPIFIDHLSIRRYRAGEFWRGHRQFCEQFLNPLLLRAFFGIPHNSWYRGNLEGIPQAEFADLVPLRRRLSWRLLSNVILPAQLQRRFTSDSRPSLKLAERQLPLVGFTAMLKQLLAWISRLEPCDRHATTWAAYSGTTTYNDEETRLKHAFVADFIHAVAPETVVDLGCNTGNYSRVALQAGAKSVVGFDFDQQALDQAYRTAAAESLDFLPLYLDAANPSPRQGWMQSERDGFADRVRADAVLALAFEHHLAIGRNVPIDDVVGWIVDIAPNGVIEFVSKSDPTVQEMLSLREDVFDDYTPAAFEAALQRRARIVKRKTVSASGRTLYAYSRAG